jgi:hypothetical protein
MTTSHRLPRPVLQRFGQVGWRDLRVASQVGDGAGELEDAVIGAGRELECAALCLASACDKVHSTVFGGFHLFEHDYFEQW